MEALTAITSLFVLWGVVAWGFTMWLTVRIAIVKGWSGVGWFGFGCLFGPLALLGIIGLPERDGYKVL